MAALAKQELNNLFEFCGLNKVSFSSGYTANVYMGVLLWASSDTPSNHSPFSFSKVKPTQATNHKKPSHHPPAHPDPRVRHDGWKNQGIKQAGSTCPNELPRDAQTASAIIFGKFRAGSQSLWALMNTMDCHKLFFKAKECPQKEFPVKFLLAVNSRFQIRLKECKSATNWNKVDNTIINFAPFGNQVIIGSFHMELPPTFKMKS
jgi:hypothetical protein